MGNKKMGIEIQKHMKNFFVQILDAIIKKASSETRVNFALSLIAGDVQSLSGLENWKLFHRIYNRFMKSYPMQPSIESLRTYGFYKLIGELKNIPGAIIECGVGRARYLVVLEYANQFFKLGRTVYGFDTFVGFPAAHKNDIGLRVMKDGAIIGWETNSADIARTVIETDMLEHENVIQKSSTISIVTVPGLFKDTLPFNLPEKIAFLHADADLYESTRDILVYALPRMSSGGWIIFDELHETEKWPGVKKAVDEFCITQGLNPQWVPELHRLGIKIP